MQIVSQILVELINVNILQTAFKIQTFMKNTSI